MFELRPVIHRDARGLFIETFHQAKFAELGIADTFIQDNHSRSSIGTLRGFTTNFVIHKRKSVASSKAKRWTLRLIYKSAHRTSEKWTSVLLSAKVQNQIYVPKGFAHGFLALSDTVQFLYKCSDFYHPADERGIAWNDPDLKISWGLEAPIISGRDSAFPVLARVPREFLPEYLAK